MDEADDIDVALDRHWSSLRLPLTLKAGFEGWNEKAYRHENRFSLCVLLVVTLSFAALDARAGLFAMGLPLRFGLQGPAIIWGIARLNREVSARAGAYAVAVPLATVVGSSIPLCMSASAENASIYFMAVGVAILAANLALRIRLRHAAVVCAVDVALYAVVPLSRVYGSPGGQAVAVIAIMSSLTVMSLMAVVRRERGDQDIYLLKRRSELQSTELQRLVSELSRLSNIDALTGIGNRRSFDHAREELWTAAARDGMHLALALIDIDHFKALNDIAGHGEGDRCLHLVAQAIAGQARPECDVVARFGGEEFAVLIPLPADECSALVTADMLGERMREGVELLDLPHPGSACRSVVTVSVGLALACPGRQGETAEALLEAADRALYGSKRTGRNRVTRVVIEPLSAAA